MSRSANNGWRRERRDWTVKTSLAETLVEEECEAMPIIINEMDTVFPVEPPAEGDLAGRIIALERHVQVLEATVRDLDRYCQNLEAACRAALAESPGRAPFPSISRHG